VARRRVKVILPLLSRRKRTVSDGRRLRAASVSYAAGGFSCRRTLRREL
jgi:hypothetical protein